MSMCIIEFFISKLNIWVPLKSRLTIQGEGPLIADPLI